MPGATARLEDRISPVITPFSTPKSLPERVRIKQRAELIKHNTITNRTDLSDSLWVFPARVKGIEYEHIDGQEKR